MPKPEEDFTPGWINTFLSLIRGEISPSDLSISSDQVWKWSERALLILLGTHFIMSQFKSDDKKNVWQRFASSITNTKIGKQLIRGEIEKEVKKSVSEMFSTQEGRCVKFPEKGMNAQDIEKEMLELKKLDVKTMEGKAFAYVYHLTQDHDEFVTKMHNLFIVSLENIINHDVS